MSVLLPSATPPRATALPSELSQRLARFAALSALALLVSPVSAGAQPRQAPPPIAGSTPAPTPTATVLPPVPPPPAAGSPAEVARPSGDEAAILDAINTLRAAQSLGPLVTHGGLVLAARQHSLEMAAAHVLAHVSPTTGTPADRAAAAGVRALRVTQNISRRPSASAAHEAILASDAHRAQLLDPAATHIGVGIAVGDDGVYLTELMARMVPEPVLPPPSVADVPQPPGASTPDLADPEPEPYEQEPAPEPEPPQPRAQPVQAQAQVQVQPGAEAEAQADAGATIPTLRITRAHRGVAGYWLFHQGRWWYFPIPPNTRHGQLIYPDTRVQGSPPGYQGTPQTATQVPTRVQPPVTTAPRGYWRLTPQ